MCRSGKMMQLRARKHRSNPACVERKLCSHEVVVTSTGSAVKVGRRCSASPLKASNNNGRPGKRPSSMVALAKG